MKNRKSMLFYYDWRDILIDSFNGDYATIGKIILALVNYSQCKEMPDYLNETEMIAFYFMYNQVDRDSEKYSEIVEKRRQSGLKSAEKRRNAREENDD